jgi:hypothetical protein
MDGQRGGVQDSGSGIGQRGDALEVKFAQQQVGDKALDASRSNPGASGLGASQSRHSPADIEPQKKVQASASTKKADS